MAFSELWAHGWLFSLLETVTFQDGQEWLALLLTLGAVVLSGILIPYLLGSINTALILSRLLYHDDVREHGSGNAGMTNMLRTYGKTAALLTLAGDVLKAVLAVGIASLLSGSSLGGWIGALFCTVGHVFPLYYGFRGGKGVLCTAAAILLLDPFAFLCCFLTFLILVSMTKFVSLGSIFAALMLPLYVNISNTLTGHAGINGIISVVLALFIIWCHRANIERLRAGTESKLSFGGKKTPPPTDGGEADA